MAANWVRLARFGGSFVRGRVGAGAAVLELGELIEDLEVAVGEAGLVARELGERIGAGDRALGHGADQIEFDLFRIGGQSFREGLVMLAGVAELFGKHAGLELRDAAHAPFGVGELAEQGPLQGGFGLELGLQFGYQELEIFDVFAGKHGGLRPEAVLEGVLR